MSDLSLRAAQDDGVLPESDPTLFAIAIAVLALAAVGLALVTKGRLGCASGPSSAAVNPVKKTASAQHG